MPRRPQRPRRPRRPRRVLRLLLLVLAVTACSPYDPALPPAPFLCADREPRCPDGYVCRSEPDGRQVCRSSDTVVDAGALDAVPLAPPRTP